MRQKSETNKIASEQVVKDIRRATRNQYSAEDKIRIVLDGLRGEYSTAELCRREGIGESLYSAGRRSSWRRARGGCRGHGASRPAFIVMKAADEFKDKTTPPNQLWQTDFTYLKVIGWGWPYLSTVLDDFSRYIIAGKLCMTMKVEDVTDTLNLALRASVLDEARVAHRPRLLSMNHVRGAPFIPRPKARSNADTRR